MDAATLRKCDAKLWGKSGKWPGVLGGIVRGRVRQVSRWCGSKEVGGSVYTCPDTTGMEGRREGGGGSLAVPVEDGARRAV